MPTQIALIGNSTLGNSYARTIIESRPDLELKYIFPNNNLVNIKLPQSIPEIMPIKRILGDPNIKFVILAEEKPQIIKLACEYKKPILLLPTLINSLKSFYQAKCIIKETQTPYHIPIQSKVHSDFQSFKNKLTSTNKNDLDCLSFIKITHNINQYEDYWNKENLHDIDFMQWITDSDVCEVYAKQTTKSLFIQLLLENNCLCNIEITISHIDNKTTPEVVIQTLNKSYKLSEIKEINRDSSKSYLSSNTQSMHLNHLINNIDNKKHCLDLIDHSFNLLAIQKAAKQSLRENKPIRVSSVISNFTCVKNSISPINYFNNYIND